MRTSKGPESSPSSQPGRGLSDKDGDYRHTCAIIPQGATTWGLKGYFQSCQGQNPGQEHGIQPWPNAITVTQPTGYKIERILLPAPISLSLSPPYWPPSCLLSCSFPPYPYPHSGSLSWQSLDLLKKTTSFPIAPIPHKTMIWQQQILRSFYYVPGTVPSTSQVLIYGILPITL